MPAMRTATDTLWWVYVLVCENDGYYVGMTQDVPARARAHAAGQGAKFTRAHPVRAVVGALPVGSRAQAARLERRVKRWSPEHKHRRFSPFFETWRRCTPEESVMTTPEWSRLDIVLAAIGDLESQRRTLETEAWSALTHVAPELIDLIRQTGLDDAAAAAWVCAPNDHLSNLRPATRVLSGHSAEVMAMVVRALNGIR